MMNWVGARLQTEATTRCSRCWRTLASQPGLAGDRGGPSRRRDYSAQLSSRVAHGSSTGPRSSSLTR